MKDPARHPDGLSQMGPSELWGTLAGQPTDDSELAKMLAWVLLRHSTYDGERAFEAYQWWLKSGPFDCGNTIRAALRGTPNHDSQANGALMRQSPLAIWGHAQEPAALDRIVREDTALTHPNPVCGDASAAFIVALAAVIREGLGAREAHERAVHWSKTNGTSPSVTEALEAAAHSKPDYGTHAGWVLVALQNAFYQALHAKSFKAGVVDTVMSGGDTDTNAAIAGALLGAIHGAGCIPSDWRQRLERTCDHGSRFHSNL